MDLLRVLMLFAGIMIVVIWLAHYSKIEVSGNIRIVDGDSLVVGGEELRLFGIDAPEYSQTCKAKAGGADYNCGKQARHYLQNLVKSGDVLCSGFERDKYDRLLAVCKIGEKDINQDMVISGWAVSFGSYSAEEAEAEKAKRGIWSGEFETPSKWRRNKQEFHSKGFLSSVFGW